MLHQSADGDIKVEMLIMVARHDSHLSAGQGREWILMAILLTLITTGSQHDVQGFVYILIFVSRVLGVIVDLALLTLVFSSTLESRLDGFRLESGVNSLLCDCRRLLHILPHGKSAPRTVYPCPIVHGIQK